MITNDDIKDNQEIVFIEGDYVYVTFYNDDFTRSTVRSGVIEWVREKGVKLKYYLYRVKLDKKYRGRIYHNLYKHEITRYENE